MSFPKISQEEDTLSSNTLNNYEHKEKSHLNSVNLSSIPLDDLDRKLLDIIQTNFPITSRPYEQLGQQLGLTEAETLARVRSMREKGIIRRIGANFQSKKLGWKSTLCAASVPEEKLDFFIREVNNHEGVTHNYLRRHRFNVWFTYIGPTWPQIIENLEDISSQTGIQVLNLPSKRTFKIRVDFRMEDSDDPEENT